MGALQSIRPAVRGVVHNPIVIAITGLYGLVQLPQLLLQGSDPMIAAAVSLLFTGVMILFAPFFQGGIIAMADEAIAGHTRLDTLFHAGKSNYVSLLVAYLVLIAVNLLFGLLVFVGVLIGGVGLFLGDGEPSLALVAVLVGAGLFVGIAYLLVVLFVQFYAHAIVLDDTELVAGFKRSVSLVRQNLLSVLGYSVILIVGGGLLGVIGAAASMPFTAEPAFGTALPDPSLPVLVAAAVVYLVVTALMGALYAAYSVAFYRDISVSRQAPERL